MERNHTAEMTLYHRGEMLGQDVIITFLRDPNAGSAQLVQEIIENTEQYDRDWWSAVGREIIEQTPPLLLDNLQKMVWDSSSSGALAREMLIKINNIEFLDDACEKYTSQDFGFFSEAG